MASHRGRKPHKSRPTGRTKSAGASPQTPEVMMVYGLKGLIGSNAEAMHEVRLTDSGLENFEAWAPERALDETLPLLLEFANEESEVVVWSVSTSRYGGARQDVVVPPNSKVMALVVNPATMSFHRLFIRGPQPTQAMVLESRFKPAGIYADHAVVAAAAVHGTRDQDSFRKNELAILPLGTKPEQIVDLFASACTKHRAHGLDETVWALMEPLR